MPAAYLSRRALRHLDEIHTFSMREWGNEVADQYLADLRAAVQRLEDLPSLLTEGPDVSGRLRFYRSRRHWIVYDVIDEDIFVLALFQTSMDLPRRLAELEPQLASEAELLSRRVRRPR